jgi:hypothetical protein
MRLRILATSGALSLGALGPAGAQQTAAPQYPPPEVGQLAPDFTVAGSTRYGLLRDSIRLSSFRGQTVVIAFFFKARTRG